MDIRRVLGVTVSPATEDTLNMVLTDRFAKIAKGKSPEMKKRLAEKDKIIMDLVMEHYSDDKEECEKFLNEVLDCDCEEQEECYLHGVKDTVRFFKELIRI